MRVKLMVATTVVVAAMGLTSGALLLSKAEGQQPSSLGRPAVAPGASAPPVAPKPSSAWMSFHRGGIR